ncbi:hypothetical protein GCM10028774_66620 [Spirosoma jeollabukense]
MVRKSIVGIYLVQCGGSTTRINTIINETIATRLINANYNQLIEISSYFLT